MMFFSFTYDTLWPQISWPQIEPLIRDNFQTWKDSLLLHLGWHEVDLALMESKPVEPKKDATGYAELKKAYDTKVKKWERSNRMALLIMNFSISTEIKGAIPLMKVLPNI